MADSLNTFFFIGRPLSPLYSVAMKIRETLYMRGMLKSHALPVPVISIGNLVMGGTGKTPVVRHIAEVLQKNGFKPAIISRGYKGKAKKKVNVVSDGTLLHLSPSQAGDEPYMLAQMLKNVPVLTGSRRIHPSRFAIDNLHADVLILDDGFQHLAIKRDLDVVLFDATTLAGNSRVFPGGELREPVSALNRCQIILLTGVTDANKVRALKFKQLLEKRYPSITIFFSRQYKHQFCNSEEENIQPSSIGSCFAFCGIANPSRFKNSLKNTGVPLNGFLPLKDHVVYTQSLVSSLCQKAKNTQSKCIITTEKDYVKVQNFTTDLPLMVFKIRHQLDDKFDDLMLSSLQNMR